MICTRPNLLKQEKIPFDRSPAERSEGWTAPGFPLKRENVTPDRRPTERSEEKGEDQA